MAVTMETAEQALKIYYTDVLRDQLNTDTDEFYNRVKSSNKHVVGKEVRRMAPYGVNGGIAAGGEVGPLPTAAGNNYIQFVSETKNLYGVIELSDKSIAASANNSGAFVQLLDSELSGLMRAAKFNLSRMLHTDGKGVLTTCLANAEATTALKVATTKYMIEGLVIDIRASNGSVVTGGDKRRILSVDRINNIILISGANITTEATDFITVQGSYNMELTGLAELFKKDGTLYGVDRTKHHWMIPYIKDDVGDISDIKIAAGIDHLSEITGSNVNYILTSSGVRRSYQAYLEATKRNVNTLKLAGGASAITYVDIPIVSSRFAKEGTMKLLDTTQFMFHQMKDWDWMDRGGKVLQQVPGTPLWTATLVKYTELICDHPGGQAELRGITEDSVA